MCTTRRTWKPGVSASTMKQVMPPRPLRGVGAGEDDAEVGAVGAGDEDLGAVDHPAVAVALGLGLDGARRIAAARRLGQAEEAALLAAQHREEVALLLVLVGLEELRQARAAERAVAGRVEPGAMLRHLDRRAGCGSRCRCRGRRTPAGCRCHRGPSPWSSSTSRAWSSGSSSRGVGIELGLQRH